jgi:hypothetical protein
MLKQLNIRFTSNITTICKPMAYTDNMFKYFRLIGTALLFFILLLLFCGSGIVFAFSGGNGTQANPYLISNINDLNTLADSTNNGNNWSAGKYFKQTQSILDTFRNTMVTIGAISVEIMMVASI